MWGSRGSLKETAVCPGYLCLPWESMKLCTGINSAHLLINLPMCSLFQPKALTIREIAFEVDRVWEWSSKPGWSPPGGAGSLPIHLSPKAEDM